jgi:hypothetical protein
MADDQNGYIGGVLNMTGARPGEAFRYAEPTMRDMLNFTVSFTSTYEAIERLIVPPPLKVDRDKPPVVQATYFISRHNLAFDGRVTPYHAFMFMAHVNHSGRSAMAGWEYVDGLYGDKTEMDIMGPWSVYFGMLKKMADITFLPVGLNEFEVTVNRRGVRLVTMRLRMGEELTPDALALVNEGFASSGGNFTVREIPNTKYSGFVDRSICWTPTDHTRASRAFSASDGFIEFGSLALDPLSDMPVLGINQAVCFQATSDTPVFNSMEVVEHLPGSGVSLSGE